MSLCRLDFVRFTTFLIQAELSNENFKLGKKTKREAASLLILKAFLLAKEEERGKRAIKTS